eukprot:3302909-Rhodomonas_salina.1
MGRPASSSSTSRTCTSACAQSSRTPTARSEASHPLITKGGSKRSRGRKVLGRVSCRGSFACAVSRSGRIRCRSRSWYLHQPRQTSAGQCNPSMSQHERARSVESW